MGKLIGTPLRRITIEQTKADLEMAFDSAYLEVDSPTKYHIELESISMVSSDQFKFRYVFLMKKVLPEGFSSNEWTPTY